MLGQGHVFSPAPLVGMRFGGRRDYTFGICERPWPGYWDMMDQCSSIVCFSALLCNPAEKQVWLVVWAGVLAAQLVATVYRLRGPCPRRFFSEVVCSRPCKPRWRSLASALLLMPAASHADGNGKALAKIFRKKWSGIRAEDVRCKPSSPSPFSIV